jgi:hypothetical protein
MSILGAVYLCPRTHGPVPLLIFTHAGGCTPLRAEPPGEVAEEENGEFPFVGSTSETWPCYGVLPSNLLPYSEA